MMRKVWTILSMDVVYGEDGVDAAAIESYCTKEDAVEGCADYFMERLDVRPDIRYAVGHDARHPHVAEDIHRKTGIPVEAVRAMFASPIAIGERNAAAEACLRGMVEEEVRATGGYTVATGADSEIGECTFQFGIDGNFLND